jgi:hypothetical protein
VRLRALQSRGPITGADAQSIATHVDPRVATFVTWFDGCTWSPHNRAGTATNGLSAISLTNIFVSGADLTALPLDTWKFGPALRLVLAKADEMLLLCPPLSACSNAQSNDCSRSCTKTSEYFHCQLLVDLRTEQRDRRHATAMDMLPTAEFGIVPGDGISWSTPWLSGFAPISAEALNCAATKKARSPRPLIRQVRLRAVCLGAECNASTQLPFAVASVTRAKSVPLRIRSSSKACHTEFAPYLCADQAPNDRD